jgi:hypothetical protein
MSKGILYYACSCQVEGLQAATRAVRAWHEDLDFLSFAADLTEWIRRCAKGRDDVNALYQRAVRQTMTNPDALAATGPAFLDLVEATLQLCIAVKECVPTGERVGQPAMGVEELERAIREVTISGEKFLSRYPKFHSHPATQTLARFASDQPAAPTGETLADFALSDGPLPVASAPPSTPRMTPVPRSPAAGVAPVPPVAPSGKGPLIRFHQKKP